MGSSAMVKEDSGMDGVAANSAPSASAPSASAPDSGAFAEGEKVLAYHGTRFYEAKIQKAERKKGEWRYFVHYLGWNKNWDEWVRSDRLLKFTEDNVRKQRALGKKQLQDKTVEIGWSTQNKPKNSNGKGKKRKSQPGIEEKDRKLQKSLLMSQFPLSLKKQLVDDWEFVVQLGKLIKLPRAPNVDHVLKKYLEYRRKKDGMISESIMEIMKGLRCYFDKALPAILLYKSEQQQYREAVRDNVSPSTIYGAEHLLRLFVKLPELLADVVMEEEAVTNLQQKLLEILKFLQDNQSSFFLSTYDSSKGSD